MADDIQMMAKQYLKPNYVFIAVGEIGGACKDVKQEIMEVTKFEKKKELIKVLESLGYYFKIYFIFEIVMIKYIFFHIPV